MQLPADTDEHPDNEPEQTSGTPSRTHSGPASLSEADQKPWYLPHWVCPQHLAVHLGCRYCGVTDRRSSVTGFYYQFSAPENGSLSCMT